MTSETHSTAKIFDGYRAHHRGLWMTSETHSTAKILTATLRITVDRGLARQACQAGAGAVSRKILTLCCAGDGRHMGPCTLVSVCYWNAVLQIIKLHVCACSASFTPALLRRHLLIAPHRTQMHCSGDTVDCTPPNADAFAQATPVDCTPPNAPALLRRHR